MSNLTDFFPAPFGGFTKQSTYGGGLKTILSTTYAGFDNTIYLKDPVLNSYPVSATEFTIIYFEPTSRFEYNIISPMVYKNVSKTAQLANNVTEFTFTSTSFDFNLAVGTPIFFMYADVRNDIIYPGDQSTSWAFPSVTHVINPANDLGLSDGSPVSFFAIGGGFDSKANPDGQTSGNGGLMTSGIFTVTDASANITIISGKGGYHTSASNRINPTATTISYGDSFFTTDNGLQSGLGGDAGLYPASPGPFGYGGGGLNKGSQYTPGVNGNFVNSGDGGAINDFDGVNNAGSGGIAVLNY
jgi:hypothetical protein